MGTGFWVDIAALRQGATRTAAIAAALDESTPVADGATGAAIAASAGWAAAAALRACAQAWRDRLKGARENLTSIGAGLKANAAAYELADQDAAARIARVIQDLGG